MLDGWVLWFEKGKFKLSLRYSLEGRFFGMWRNVSIDKKYGNYFRNESIKGLIFVKSWGIFFLIFNLE